MIEAEFYKKIGNSVVKCELCPHACLVKDGFTGFCRVRQNVNGKLYSKSWGKISGINVDPIEKKPLKRFFKGSKIFSIGSVGCNMKCAFCQNSSISQDDQFSLFLSPKELCDKVLSSTDNLGIAFTYNEPIVNIEFILDVCDKLKDKSLKIVLVTNGLICLEPLEKLLNFVDAVNVDLKSFNEDFYLELGGNLDVVKKTIEKCSKICHVEVTTLIIPQKNDTASEMSNLSNWLAAISCEIPLHLSRFFPSYKMKDKSPTKVETLFQLQKIAEKKLKFVYLGNI
ncbi:MAG: AmmeMemoRadiSam system radical SAM enzyme [Oscillospiraceae bacterium]|nr:AmmeMemoRadiSam system radical SAM enzyme [Oscillospiraceae bacterium]